MSLQNEIKDETDTTLMNATEPVGGNQTNNDYPVEYSYRGPEFILLICLSVTCLIAFIFHKIAHMITA